MHDLETAIGEFEQAFDCKITAHQFSKVFIGPDGKSMLGPKRPSHRQTFPCCMAEERDYCIQNCMFDFNRKVAAGGRKYYLKRCRNQYIEVAVPLYRHNNHIATFFAGLWRRPADPVKIRRLCRIFPFFCEGLLREAESISRSRHTDFRFMERINEFIAFNFPKPVSVSDLAKDLSLSVSRTCHVVKTIFGQTFSELLTAERLSHAKFYLTNSDYRLHEIAQICGFGSAEHFNRMFSRHYQMPPGEYRRRNKAIV